LSGIICLVGRQNGMTHSVLDPRTGTRLIIRPPHGRYYEHRARRHVLRELDRLLLKIGQQKPQQA
jgi:hypothetical protein